MLSPRVSLSHLLGVLHGLNPVDPLAEIPSANEAVDAAGRLMGVFRSKLSARPEWSTAESLVGRLGDEVRRRETDVPGLKLFLAERQKGDLLAALRSLGLLPLKGEPAESGEELALRLQGVTYLRDARVAIDALDFLQSLQPASPDLIGRFRETCFAVVDAVAELVPEFRAFSNFRHALGCLHVARTREASARAGALLQDAGVLPQKGEAPDRAWTRLRETAAFFKNVALVQAAAETDLPFLSAVSAMIQFKGEALPDRVFVEVNRRLARLAAAWEAGELETSGSRREAGELKKLLAQNGLLPETDQTLDGFWGRLETACLEHSPTLKMSPEAGTLPPPSGGEENPVVRETEENLAEIGVRPSRYLPYPAQTKAGWLLFLTQDEEPRRARPYLYRLGQNALLETRKDVTSCRAGSYRERFGGPSLTSTPVVVEFWNSEKAFRRTLKLYQERLRGIESVSRIMNTGYGLGAEGQPVPFSVVEDNAPSLRNATAVFFKPGLSGPSWDLNRALTVGIKILRALRSLEAKEVVHQALSPERIRLVPGMFDPQNGRELWIDGFEHGRIAGSVDSFSGVPGYTSRDTLEVSQHIAIPALDLYAFAAIFYEILTGRVPFLPRHVDLKDDRKPEDLTRVILENMRSPMGLPPLKDANPLLPEDLDRLIRKLLQSGYAPDPRHWSAASVLEAFLGFWER